MLWFVVESFYADLPGFYLPLELCLSPMKFVNGQQYGVVNADTKKSNT